MKKNAPAPVQIRFTATARQDEPALGEPVFIPPRLVARIESYAIQQGIDSHSVVIEAIDTFLRSRSNRDWL